MACHPGPGYNYESGCGCDWDSDFDLGFGCRHGIRHCGGVPAIDEAALPQPKVSVGQRMGTWNDTIEASVTVLQIASGSDHGKSLATPFGWQSLEREKCLSPTFSLTDCVCLTVDAIAKSAKFDAPHLPRQEQNSLTYYVSRLDP